MNKNSYLLVILNQIFKKCNLLNSDVKLLNYVDTGRE